MPVYTADRELVPGLCVWEHGLAPCDVVDAAGRVFEEAEAWAGQIRPAVPVAADTETGRVWYRPYVWSRASMSDGSRAMEFLSYGVREAVLPAPLRLVKKRGVG